jgi:hypothetical protein
MVFHRNVAGRRCAGRTAKPDSNRSAEVRQCKSAKVMVEAPALIALPVRPRFVVAVSRDKSSQRRFARVLGYPAHRSVPQTGTETIREKAGQVGQRSVRIVDQVPWRGPRHRLARFNAGPCGREVPSTVCPAAVRRSPACAAPARCCADCSTVRRGGIPCRVRLARHREGVERANCRAAFHLRRTRRRAASGHAGRGSCAWPASLV